MDQHAQNEPVGLLLSGGLDSCILLGYLLGQGHRVQPLHIRSDLAWQAEELRAIDGFLTRIASPAVARLVVLDLPLGDLYGNHWSVTGQGVPDDATPDDAVYLPGRNALLLVKAAIWCGLHGIERLALGVLRSNPFSDATSGFFDSFQSALTCALGSPIRILRPFAQFDKRQVMQHGRGLPLQATFSCIAPVDGRHCGRCNKCAERIAAFRSAGFRDPTDYAAKTISEQR